MCFILWPPGLWWRLVQGFLRWFVGWSRVWSAAISWVSWWAPVGRWSAVWGVMVRIMCINTWVWTSWITPVMLFVVPMVGPRTASVGVMAVLAVVSLMMRLWPGPTASVPVFVMVARGWSMVVSMSRLWSMVMCRFTWRWHPVWTIHYYVSVFITLETPYTGAMMCYVTWFLALEAAILLMRHNIYCWGWYQCGSKLLCGLEFLNFRYSICESLWSLFLDLSG